LTSYCLNENCRFPFMNKKIIISLLLGFVISSLGLYLGLRNVPLPALYLYLKSINYFWVIPASVIVIFSFVARVLRWQVILTSSHKVGFFAAFHPLMIGFMINCILPGRIGEVARPAIIKKNVDIPFSTGLATVAAERAFDMMILMGLFAWMLSTVDFHSGVDISFRNHHLNKATLETIGNGMVKLSFLLIIGICLLSVSASRKLINRGIMALPSLFSFLGPSAKSTICHKICTALVNFLENLSIGFSLVRYPVKILLCIGLSIIIWSLQAYSYYLVARGCPGISLSYVDIYTVMIIICFFIALPSVPGFWGLWEAGGVFALALFGVSSKEAAGYTLANHAIQMLPVVIIGLISAVSISVNIWQVSYGKNIITSPGPARNEK